jgi:hypothetical protein
VGEEERGGWYQWEGGDGGEGCRRVNMVQILCTHVHNVKMIPVETILGMGKGEQRRRRIKV